METIGEAKLWTFQPNSNDITSLKCSKIRNNEAHLVQNYIDLASKIALLQFRNRDHVLLFRGQSKDYQNRKKNTTLPPSLFRPTENRILDKDTLESRFQKLSQAEQLLVNFHHDNILPHRDFISKHRIIRWSIIQHYGICGTPLLDVTHSLRIAASFASSVEADEAFIFVLGVPNISGAITASAEAGLQIVRLSSVCPPNAVRPHIQEGYLLGEYPEMTDYSQKQHYRQYEIDFGRRLVAKFKFNPQTFWSNELFPRVRENALYPDDNDPIFPLAESIKAQLEASQ